MKGWHYNHFQPAKVHYNPSQSLRKAATDFEIKTQLRTGDEAQR